MRGILVLGVTLLGLILTARLAAGADEPDPRFILQTQAGLSAYAQITGTLTTDYVRPVFTHVDLQTADYIFGDYQPSGHPISNAVKLMVHRDGWAVAWHPRTYHVGHLFDCYGYPYNTNPTFMPNRPETAIRELGTALGVTNTVASFYDFGHPAATAITLHWLIQRNISTINSSITPPLANTYIQRAAVFCSITPNNEYKLNDQLIGKTGSSITVALYQFGLLAENQLRAGQANTLAVKQDLVLFYAIGVLGGTALEYTGSAPVATVGGNVRQFDLEWPAFLGAPVVLMHIHLPVVRRE